MKYKLDELLDEEEVAELTAEALDGAGKRRGVWKRVAALAACMALAVGVFNFDAIAVGIERAWRYVSGVGALAPGAQVLVQTGGESVYTRGDRTYLIDGAYIRDSVFYLPVDVISKSDELLKNGQQTGLYLRAWLYQGDTMLEAGDLLHESTGFAKDKEVKLPGGVWLPRNNEWAYFQGSFDPLEGLVGSYIATSYQPQGYLTAGRGVALFRIPDGMDPAGTYTVKLTDTVSGLTWEMPLVMAEPTAAGAYAEARTIGEGTVTAVVAADGRGVSLFAALDEAHIALGERLMQLSMIQDELTKAPVYFIDTEGNRCPGELRRSGANFALTPEILLTDADFGPVTAIEIDILEYNILVPGRHVDERGGSAPNQRWQSYKDVNWVIELP